MKFSSLISSLSNDKNTTKRTDSTSPIPTLQSTSNSFKNNSQSKSSSTHSEIEVEECSICGEDLSLRLVGEKPHITPICGHKLHSSCFTAVYGKVTNARGGTSLVGCCGICRKDMKVGSEQAERKNKFAAISGEGSQSQGSNFSRSISQTPFSDDSSEILFSDLTEEEDDDLVQIPTSISNLRLHNSLGTLHGKASAETMKGNSSLSTSSSINNNSRTSSPGLFTSTSLSDVVKPIITVRSEHKTVVRSINREEVQHLTCLVSIEMPSKYYSSEKERIEKEWQVQKEINDQRRSELSLKSRGSTSTKRTIISEISDSTSIYTGQPSSPTSSSFSSPNNNYNTTSLPVNSIQDPLAPVVEDLLTRMEDWKGHSPSEFGRLKLCDYIYVRKQENIREFLVYLFDEAILCVTDDKRKGDGKGRDNLRLKGRVYVKHIRTVVDTSKTEDLSLTIYMSDDTLDEFIMTFQDAARMKEWKTQLENLISLHHLSPTQRLAAARGASMALSTSMTGSLSADSTYTVNSDYSNTSDVFGRSPVSNSSSLSSFSKSSKPKTTDDNVINEEEESYDMNHFNLSNPPKSKYATSSIGSNTYPQTPSTTSSNSYPHTTSPISLTSHLHSTNASSPTSSTYSSPSLHTTPNSKDFTPLDLMLILSLPLPSSGSSTLKLRILKSSLHFILQTVGIRTRISLITYQVGEGNSGKLGKTPFISIGTDEGRSRFERLIDELGSDIIGEAGLFDHNEERVNVASGVNTGLDILLQRKTKSASTGIILLNDSVKDGTQKADMDLVFARIETAKIPLHTIGWGNHNESSLYLLSNFTSGSYTFVKEFYDLREALAGVIGSILSIGITQLKLHLSVPEKRFFRIRKVAGIQSKFFVLSSTGLDVDVEIGELRFGEKRDLLIEVEMSLGSFGEVQSLPKIQLESPNNNFGVAGKVGAKKGMVRNATDAFFLDQVGVVNPSDDFQPSNFYEEDVYAHMTDTAPLFEINASYKDLATGKTVSRLSPFPTLLTIIIEPPTVIKTVLPSNASNNLATIFAPQIVQRRIELLCSDMLTRTLLLMSRRSDNQAKKLLGETLRIITTINSSLSPTSNLNSSYTAAHSIAFETLKACSEDISTILSGCSDRSLFELNIRAFCAQLVGVLRDQRSWTARTPVERIYFNSDLSIWSLQKSKAFISP